ncbi:MAG: WbqC family protein [Muribaculum sp.]|uniref:WbqC family protein n=1 Tax=Candidatus Merdivivens faecigallinarum TaxID=2840871 RepID=A0A9D9IYH6_9BACT|nr:WbqC family protein [Candidatus Merdivivens faecigallinarum]
MHRVGLLSTAYLPPVSYFTVMAKYGAVSIEACENFQKQSYRTRARIASSSGTEYISVPILKGEGHKRPISEIEIDYKRDWVLSHKRALMSCYGSAPFYIYYKDDIFSVLDSRPRFLLDLNTSLTRVLAGLLGIRCEIRFTDSYVAPAAVASGVVPGVVSAVVPGVVSAAAPASASSGVVHAAAASDAVVASASSDAGDAGVGAGAFADAVVASASSDAADAGVGAGAFADAGAFPNTGVSANVGASSDANDLLHTDTAFNAGATLQDSTSLHDDTVLQDDGRASIDFRYCIHPKRPLPTGFLKGGEYYQVFADRLGFIPDLSAVDLLFNEGPNAISFLK